MFANIIFKMQKNISSLQCQQNQVCFQMLVAAVVLEVSSMMNLHSKCQMCSGSQVSPTKHHANVEADWAVFVVGGLAAVCGAGRGWGRVEAMLGLLGLSHHPPAASRGEPRHTRSQITGGLGCLAFLYKIKKVYIESNHQICLVCVMILGTCTQFW